MVKPQYLLDTNIISEGLRSRPNALVMKKLERFDGGMAIASTVWHELIYGEQLLIDAVKQRIVKKYLEEVVAVNFPVIPYDEIAAAWHAKERARLQKKGYIASFSDGQIAAVAKVHGLTIVTRNTKDFSRFDGLSIENWFLA